MIESQPQAAGGSADEPTLAGVPLLQYAAVVAAQGDCIRLAEVLEIEGIDESRWSRAQQAFAARLCTDGACFDRFRERLVEAQDRLSRRVIPLDDDLAAWTSFLVQCDARGTPAVLRAHYLHPNDLTRLTRLWSWKLENPLLVKRVIHLAAQARKGRLEPPPIHVGPTVLRPSPAARAGRRSANHGGAATGDVDGVFCCDLDTFARLDCILRAHPDERSAVFETYGMTLAVGEQVERAWRAQIARDAAIRADFRALVAHHERAVAPASRVGSNVGAAGQAPTLHALADAGDPPRESRAEGTHIAVPSLHGIDATAAQITPLGPPLPFIPATNGPQSIDETSAIVWPLREPLPFKQPGPHSAIDETSAIITPLGPALPFMSIGTPGSSDEPCSVVPPIGDPLPAVTGRLFAVDATSAVVRPLGAPLPFVDAVAPHPRQPLPVTSSPRHSVVLRIPTRELAVELIRANGGSLDATSALVPSLLEMSPLPFRGKRATTNRDARPEPDTPGAAGAKAGGDSALRATTTFSGAGPGAPELTLAQYASFCAELAAFPDHLVEVLRRYRLNDDAARDALHARWALRLRAEPALRAQFWAFHSQYLAWLRDRR